MATIESVILQAKLAQKSKENQVKNLASLRTVKKTLVSAIKVKKLVRLNETGKAYSSLTKEINSLRQFLSQTEFGIKGTIEAITYFSDKERELVSEINTLCE